MDKNGIEKICEKELSQALQQQIECATDIHGKKNKYKWWFTAGFFVAENIEKIRKVQGLED